ncbi:MAG: ABC transporter permease [Saprospiraceae bacterium]|nr:ABC transporter permease [Saprospiraceae bacterium]
MLKNYLLIALRNSWKNKTYSGINIFGLAVSLAVALLMLLWVKDELSMDRFHEKGEAIQRIFMVYPQEGGKKVANGNVAFPLLEQIEAEVPEVEEVMYFGYPQSQLVTKDKLSYKEIGMYSNTGLFKTLSFPILHGDIEQLDQGLDGIAISEALAKRFFGRDWETEAIGGNLRINDTDEFIVQAVFDDISQQSSLKFDFVLNVQHRVKNNPWLKEWGNKGMGGIILLREDASTALAQEKIDAIYKKSEAFNEGEYVKLQSYGDHYLYSQFDDQAQATGGRIEYVRLFSIAALLLLIIACINFVNLATARASKRAREVGVRKAIGAQRSSLIQQFLFESLVITTIAVAVAVLFAELCLPAVRTLVEKPLRFEYSSTGFWLTIFSVIGITAFLSGLYPAFVLSAFKPIHVLKGKLVSSFRFMNLRKLLVITQFVLALILIAGAMVIQQQISYIKNKNLGLEKENVFFISMEDKAAENYQVIKEELDKYPAVQSITAVSHNPTEVGASTTGVEWDGKRKDQRNLEFKMLWVEENFLQGFNISMADGRFYDPGMGMDTSNIILNEKAIEVMGLENPVGQRIEFWGQPVTIIGVVNNFHVGSLYEPIEPLALILDKEMGSWMFFRTEAGQTEAAISALQQTYERVLPNTPLDYQFLDEEYQRKYQGEVLTGTLAKYFAFISILIACLGLLGLSTFLAEQKTKEIGIRKVIGASTQHIVQLLSKDFLILVGSGLMLGVPIAWYLLQTWLTKFAYGINLQWWMFALPVAASILIAVLTVGAQSLKASWSNPVKALRSE